MASINSPMPISVVDEPASTGTVCPERTPMLSPWAISSSLSSPSSRNFIVRSSSVSATASPSWSFAAAMASSIPAGALPATQLATPLNDASAPMGRLMGAHRLPNTERTWAIVAS